MPLRTRPPNHMNRRKRSQMAALRRLQVSAAAPSREERRQGVVLKEVPVSLMPSAVKALPPGNSLKAWAYVAMRARFALPKHAAIRQ